MGNFGLTEHLVPHNSVYDFYALLSFAKLKPKA